MFTLIHKLLHLAKERSRSNRSESPITQCLCIPQSTRHTMRKRKFNILLRKLHPIRPLQLTRRKSTRPNNLNRPRPRTMPSRHLIIQLTHRPGKSQIPVLAVHIMRTRPRRITEPNAVVFDDAGVLFGDFDTVEDFSGGLLHFTELMHVVPKFERLTK